MEVEKDQTGTHVAWENWPGTISDDPQEHWVGEVKGWDPTTKYNWEQEFVDAIKKNDQKLYPVFEMESGDVIRSKSGEVSKFFLVNSNSMGSDTIGLEEMTEAETIRHFGGDPNHPEFVGTGKKDVDIRLSGDKEEVERVIGALEYLLGIEDMEASFAEDWHKRSDMEGHHIYGDIELDVEE